jgi:GxxExxY protein
VKLPIFYKGRKLKCAYCADFICYESIIAEIKALRQLGGVERAQVINYLKATGLHLALLINFGSPSLEYERIVH